MTACQDCGARRGGPLCAPCTSTAAALGYTAAERLQALAGGPK